jgi:hypothetical protein
MDHTTQVEEALDRIGERLSELLQAAVGEPESLSEMEREVRALMQALGNKTLGTWLSDLEGKYPPEEVQCENGETATYARRREGTMYTVLGKLKVNRAYYLYRERKGGVYPLDERLGWRPNAMSAELERLAGLVGVQNAFGKGSALLEELALVSLSDQALDKATQAYGQEVARREAEWQAEAHDPAALLRRQRENRPPVRLYGAIDGTTVHTRKANDEEREDPWRELKMGVWFSTTSQPPHTPDGEWTIQAKEMHYYTDIGDAAQFGELLWATGVQHNAHLAQELIILGDGAKWIWRLVDEHFPHAVQIVDWFHACEYIPPVAKATFRDKQQQQTWIDQVRADLWAGRIDLVISACAALVNPHLDKDKDPAQKAVTYFTNNRQRMDYPTYRAQGYQIGSGTIESAAKQIGLLRMKVPGARWNLPSARFVAKARAAFLSGEWDIIAARREKLGRAA